MVGAMCQALLQTLRRWYLLPSWQSIQEDGDRHQTHSQISSGDLVENVYGEAEVANAEALSLDCAWRMGGAAGRRKTSLGDSKEKEQLRGNGRTPHSSTLLTPEPHSHCIPFKGFENWAT